MNLPTQKTPPQVDLANQTIVVYGPVKIGKSSFCAMSDSALFLATEAGDRTGKLPETIELDYEKFLVAYKIAISDNRASKPATNSNRSKTK